MSSQLPVTYRNANPDLFERSTSLRTVVRGPARVGIAVLVLFGVGFGAWVTFAPIAAGAIAPGIISPDGNRRTVQHLEGGIIREIRARDGDLVRAGDPVMVLQSVQASATYETLVDEYRVLLAARARLEAEQVERDEMTLPDELMGVSHLPEVRNLLDGQLAIFRTRHQVHIAQKRVLNDRISQSREQIGALEAQVDSIARQLELLREEIQAKETLVEKALMSRSELLRLKRVEAELLGRRGEYLGTIAEVRQKIGEIETQRIALDAERADVSAKEMDETRAELAAVKEKLLASRDILDRTVITAPVSGKIVNSRFTSPGGVVLRGEPILEIVPTEEKLLVDARVSPADIDIVRAGLKATVHLTALSGRNTPRIDGIVRSVSADSIVDEAVGTSYYLARVEVAREEIERLSTKLELVPGMPAEVLIVTSERTMGQYLLEPFFSAFRRSFREG